MLKNIKEFINECLLFRSDDLEINKIGVLFWAYILICIACIIDYLIK
jgi:hypothetical protein